jgi:hypothetical protein
MANTLNLAYPPFFINGYIKSQLVDFGIIGPSENTPILPVTPEDAATIYQQLLQSSNVPNPLLIQYDRLLRFRPSPFYRRKREQLVYTFICSSLEKENNAMAMVIEALDRQDATAEDINAWAAANTLFDDDGITPIPKNVYFHNFRVYQVDESRDLIELASVNMNTVRGKIIIEFDYHTKDPANWPFT